MKGTNMKFAFIIMGDFENSMETACISGGEARIVGVSSLREAERAAAELQREGVGCIELCGAFGPEGARAVIRASGGGIPVGYVTHLPEQDDLYERVFPGDGKK